MTFGTLAAVALVGAWGGWIEWRVRRAPARETERVGS